MIRTLVVCAPNCFSATSLRPRYSYHFAWRRQASSQSLCSKSARDFITSCFSARSGGKRRLLLRWPAWRIGEKIACRPRSIHVLGMTKEPLLSPRALLEAEETHFFEMQVQVSNEQETPVVGSVDGGYRARRVEQGRHGLLVEATRMQTEGMEALHIVPIPVQQCIWRKEKSTLGYVFPNPVSQSHGSCR
ncbi:hypothetical protein EXIGLDRAFT_694787 [Exidia glandulosa HHB12029]|uniref:Uncharacterized protein n=1 Tax=Exidia glandulosa HHB12029 TaxID=1314781 RepID=A0A166BGA4_EXIGL|nr:hypothetical protein EXIGLDRAFT_694787 [Exidia glandulosa HHB12029]